MEHKSTCHVAFNPSHTLMHVSLVEEHLVESSLLKGFSSRYDCRAHWMIRHLPSQLCLMLWWRRAVLLPLPTIMWLQTSQNVGFLKMCSMKQCPAESNCIGLRGCERDVGGGAQGIAGGTGGMGRLVLCGGAIPMLQRWPVLLLTSERSSVLFSLLFRKKLSALLLRTLLVLKDRERLSLCSWNRRGWVQEKWSKEEKKTDCLRENEETENLWVTKSISAVTFRQISFTDAR